MIKTMGTTKDKATITIPTNKTPTTTETDTDDRNAINDGENDVREFQQKLNRMPNIQTTTNATKAHECIHSTKERVLSWNATSMKTKDRKPALRQTLEDLQIDVTIIQETFLKPNDNFRIPNYTTYRTAKVNN